MLPEAGWIPVPPPLPLLAPWILPGLSLPRPASPLRAATAVSLICVCSLRSENCPSPLSPPPHCCFLVLTPTWVSTAPGRQGCGLSRHCPLAPTPFWPLVDAFAPVCGGASPLCPSPDARHQVLCLFGRQRVGEQPRLPHSLFLGDWRWLHTDLAPHSSHLCPGPCLYPGRSRSCEKGAMFQLQSRTGRVCTPAWLLLAPGPWTDGLPSLSLLP